MTYVEEKSDWFPTINNFPFFTVLTNVGSTFQIGLLLRAPGQEFPQYTEMIDERNNTRSNITDLEL
jgi:hypothetical protein